MILVRTLSENEEVVLQRGKPENVPELVIPENHVCMLKNLKSGANKLIDGPKIILLGYYYEPYFTQDFDGELICFIPLKTRIDKKRIVIQTKDMWTIEMKCSFSIEFNKKDHAFGDVYAMSLKEVNQKIDEFIISLFKTFTIYDMLYKPKDIETYFPCGISYNIEKRDIWIVQNFKILHMNIINTQADIIPSVEEHQEIIEANKKNEIMKKLMYINPFIGSIIGIIIYNLLNSFFH